MSEGGSPALTIDRRAVAAGVSGTEVPSGMVTAWMDRVVALPEARADATTPTSTIRTARPSTTKAGPRRDMGS